MNKLIPSRALALLALLASGTAFAQIVPTQAGQSYLAVAVPVKDGGGVCGPTTCDDPEFGISLNYFATSSSVTVLASGGAGPFQANNTNGALPPSAIGANATAGGFGANATGVSSTALGAGASSSGTNSVALGANSSDGGLSNVVSVGNASAQRRIIDLAPGTSGTDAVNLNQLNALQAYDNKLASGLQTQITQNARVAVAGIATAVAMANVPQVEVGHRFALGVGFGNYGGDTGFAVRASARIADHVVVSASIGSADGQTTSGGGAMVQW